MSLFKQISKKVAEINQKDGSVLQTVAKLTSEQKKNVYFHVKSRLVEQGPETAEELWNYVRTVYGFRIPLTATTEDSNAPFEWFYDYYFDKHTQTFAIGSRGGGKALALDTPVFTTNGWKTQGTLVVGDYVYSPNGAPVEVVEVLPVQHNHDCFEVAFSDGYNITADAEHLWRVFNKQGRKTKRSVIKTTEALAVNTLLPARMSKGYLTKEVQYGIEVTKTLNFEDKQLPLDPYLLGLWLGDGCKNLYRFTTVDDELLQAFKNVFETKDNAYDPITYTVKGLSPLLRSVGYEKLGKKFIPDMYLFSNLEDRLALIQGLMDSDGTIDKHKLSISFSNKEPALIQGLEFLLNSVGIKTTKPQEKVINGTTYYNLQFSTNVEVFRLKRKLKIQQKHIASQINRLKQAYHYIKSITPVDTVPVRCIRVDALDGMYLAGKSLIPTHNTYPATFGIDMKCRFRHNYEVVHVAAEKAQAKVSQGYIAGFYKDDYLKDYFARKPSAYAAEWKSGSTWRTVTASRSGISGSHPQQLTLDEIEFWPTDAIEQSFAVPQERNGYPAQHHMFSTRQRCLPAYTRVLTEDGPMKISRLVNTKYAGKVKSWNTKTFEWEWKRVTNWYRNGSSREWYKVYLEYTGLGKGCELIATGNHQVYANATTKKPLEEFTVGDSLCVPSWVPDTTQKQVLYGTLLGDGSLDKGGHIRLEHGSNQLDYVNWKSESLGDLPYSTTYSKKRLHTLHLHANCAYTHRLRKEWYPDGTKRIPDYVWDELDVLGLAIWIMDDGCVTPVGSAGGGIYITLFALNFNEHERTKATEWFARKGIEICWKSNEKSKLTGNPLYHIRISKQDAWNVLAMISPYLSVAQHMGQGELKSKGRKNWIAEPLLPKNKKEGFELVPIKAIEKIQSAPIGMYDIEVEDNHNFLNGSNILVSNSFGASNYLTNQIEQGKKQIKLYKWTIFETMQRCPSCVCMKGDRVISNPEQACALWEDCKGIRGLKSSGWVPREEVIKYRNTLDRKEWEVQYLCTRPSSHGLVLYNFEHAFASPADLDAGNFLKWEYTPELDLYAVHDPAEGQKSVFAFFQIYNGRIFFFDELVQQPCATVSEVKKELWKKLRKEGYPDPKKIIVDPHRTDAGMDWVMGTKTGEEIERSYVVEYPDMTTGYAEIEKGLGLLRTFVCNGSQRRLYINPEKCPSLDLATREHHYRIPKGGELTDDAPPDKAYKDECDTMRYAVIWGTQFGGLKTFDLTIHLLG